MKAKAVFILALFPVLGFGGPELPVPAHVVPHLADQHYQLTPGETRADEIARILNSIDLKGGKRIRPLLCFLSAGLASVAPQEVQSLACIVEWVHQASLIHDDVIDGSTRRRDDPSLWNRSTVVQAVLMGDALQAAATRLANNLGRPEHVDSIMAAVQDMALGELIQEKARQQGSYTQEDWENVAKYKTGVLFSWALSSPAIHYRLDDHVVELFRDLGHTFGQLFQLQDDLKDAHEERGEMNLALHLAAIEDKTSPYSTVFSPAALEWGRENAKMILTAHRSKLSYLIDQLVTRTARANVLVKNSADPQHRQVCIRSLLSLATLLTTPPIDRRPAVLNGQKPR